MVPGGFRLFIWRDTEPPVTEEQAFDQTGRSLALFTRHALRGKRRWSYEPGSRTLTLWARGNWLSSGEHVMFDAPTPDDRATELIVTWEYDAQARLARVTELHSGLFFGELFLEHGQDNRPIRSTTRHVGVRDRLTGVADLGPPDNQSWSVDGGSTTYLRGEYWDSPSYLEYRCYYDGNARLLRVGNETAYEGRIRHRDTTHVWRDDEGGPILIERRVSLPYIGLGSTRYVLGFRYDQGGNLVEQPVGDLCTARYDYGCFASVQGHDLREGPLSDERRLWPNVDPLRALEDRLDECAQEH